MKLSPKLLAFRRLIKAYDDGVSHEELRRMLDERNEHIERLKSEYESHLNTVRAERDQAHIDLGEYREYVNSIADCIDHDVPSITQQTAWRSGIFDFGKAVNNPVPGTRYFNPSLANRQDGDWLITRRAVPFPKVEIGRNSIMAFKIEPGMSLFTGVHCAFREQYPDEHFEDPRACVLNGQLYISCTNFQLSTKSGWRGSHQIIVEIGPLWQSTRMWHPVYGLNGGSPYLQKGNEKNWTWFYQDGEIYMVYMIVPHRVVRMNKFMEPVQIYETQGRNPLWTLGLARGGSPPVRVGDEYFCFFHSSTPWIANKRRYHMGAYAFSARPPFRITRMTSMPLLSGSKNDPPFNGTVPPTPTIPLCVFPGGALLRNGKWLVVLGVNDFTSAWIEIPHVDLLNVMREVADTDTHGENMVLTNAKGIPLDEKGNATNSPPVFANPPA